MINKILIVGGDPNSINSEIIFKSWKKNSLQVRRKIILIANYKLIFDQFKKLKIKIKLKEINSVNEKNDINTLNIINIPLTYKNCFNVNVEASSRYVIRSLNLAHKLSSRKEFIGFINCPINKNLIKKKRIYGVTEYIAKKCKIHNSSEVMMLYNKMFSVVPITTHIKIKDVSKQISKQLIIKKIETLNDNYKKIFKKKPRLAILGLNPHNSELSKNSEEVKKIIPAVKFLKKRVNISGPMVADSFFNDSYKKYNVIIGMYHDQVLIPFKNLCKYDAINITLGLKYLRISPDHGTANNIIGKNKANPKSLLRCINFFANLK